MVGGELTIVRKTEPSSGERLVIPLAAAADLFRKCFDSKNRQWERVRKPPLACGGVQTRLPRQSAES